MTHKLSDVDIDSGVMTIKGCHNCPFVLGTYDSGFHCHLSGDPLMIVWVQCGVADNCPLEEGEIIIRKGLK